MKRISIKQNSPSDHDELEVDLNVFSTNTVKQASYKYTDRCSFSFEMLDKGKLKVIIQYLNSISEQEKEAILLSFNNEILDQDLRAQISEETEELKNIILANAFSNTKLIELE